MKKLVCLISAAMIFAACEEGIKVNAPTLELPPPTTASNPEVPNTEEDGTTETPAEKIVVAVAANYTDLVGSLASIKFDASKTVSQQIALTNSSDAVVRAAGNYVYVINRYGSDSIQVFEPKNFARIADYSVGKGTNPQDIAVVGEKAYISRMDAHNAADDPDDVIIVNPLTGERKGGLDLKQYMEDDGEQLARAGQMAVAGNYLYVACQDLSGAFTADANGKIVVINTATDSVEKSIELDGFNPFDIFYSSELEKLFVSNAGPFDPITYTTDITTSVGGIEVINAATNETEGIKIDDLGFGANISEIRIVSKELGYAIAGSKTIASFNPSSYEIINKNIYTSPHTYLPDFEVCDCGQILLTEQEPEASGILFLNPDGSVANGPIGIGANPASVEIVEVK